jgi:glycosyltransferase involved in cell wall biosynthesis
MHVSLYLKHFPPGAPVNDGTSLAVAGLAAGLADNGAEVTILCEGPVRRTLNGSGYAVECFAERAAGRSFALPPALGRFVAERLAPGRGVCVLNGMFHPSVYALARRLRRCGVPYVVAPHDPYDAAVFRRNAHLKWPYWFLFERGLLARAAAIQVLDSRHALGLRTLGVATPVIATDNGVAPERVPPVERLRWRPPGEPARLGFLGRIDAYNKGLDLLVDAFARLAPRTDAVLTLQGPDWGDRARLERRVRRAGLAARVAFPGPDYARGATEIVGDYDLFCSPSRFEGFGLAALEAMLAARVLLVSERAGIARHVAASGCGLAVEPTVDAVVAGLAALLGRRDEWRSMGLRGREHALEHLHWGSIAAQLLREYRPLAGVA